VRRAAAALPPDPAAEDPLEFPHGGWRLQRDEFDGWVNFLPLEAQAVDGDGDPISWPHLPLRRMQDDPRCWVWGCGGPMGPGGHHGQFKPDGPRPIPRHRLPPALEEFAAELGLEWWLDYTYGPRWDDGEAAAREAHGDVPLP
jgi:hypothetical protein